MMAFKLRFLKLLALILLITPPASAQGTGLTLSTAGFDPSAEVEVLADTLSVEQSSGRAVFSGNARVAQGALRLAADTISVTYDEGQNAITQISARGNVLMTNGIESAESQTATYLVDQSTISMRGNVLLVQGNTAISGDQLDLNLTSANAVMSGNVKTRISQQ